MKNDLNDWKRVRGLVVPDEWDSNGDITGIALAGYNEGETHILLDKVGRRMMSLLHEKVIVMGRHVKKDNRDLFKVKRFHKDLI
jgi:hypothetical protein